ncbi:MAG: c-type cytochrome [Proteobacteria bacterium]|nr:c-type cytochrome [Pseudomonadota bacterium]
MKKIVFASAILTLLCSAVSFAVPSTGLTPIEILGRHLYKDKNLSYNGTQSCQVCHHPFAGFADRRNALNPEVSVVSLGADGVSKGGRNAPTAAYAGFSPSLDLVGDQWVGGMFWDGRADGSVLDDPLAEQALGPPLNPLEMAMASKDAVIAVIQASTYANLFLTVFGPGAFDDVEVAYNNFGRAIAAYERSYEVTSFTSKYDKAKSRFTAAENRGMALFELNCADCHSSAAAFGAPAPLFTNYQYANIGAPANPLVPLPEPDPGLGATVSDSNQDGKFKVPTLRNIAASPPYAHNGYFASLRDMVAFINDSSAYIPELDRNIVGDVGNLGLSDSDVDDLVAFLQTLTDGY